MFGGNGATAPEDFPALVRRLLGDETLRVWTDEVELQPCGADDADGPNDISYLSPEELADPEIAANVASIRAVNGLITWGGRFDGGWIGEWTGAARDRAPCVVLLDTEGSHSVAAATLADWLLVTSYDDDEGRLVGALRKSGHDVAPSRTAAYDRCEATECVASGNTPESLRS